MCFFFFFFISPIKKNAINRCSVVFRRVSYDWKEKPATFGISVQREAVNDLYFFLSSFFPNYNSFFLFSTFFIFITSIPSCFSFLFRKTSNPCDSELKNSDSEYPVDMYAIKDWIFGTGQ